MRNIKLKNKRISFILFGAMLVIFSACQPMTIEQQVEKLMKTNDAEKRTKIAYSLADSLQTKAIDLISGFQQKNHYANSALNDMFVRYKEIAAEQKKTKKAYSCINAIQLQEAVEYLGRQSVSDNNPSIAFAFVKQMPRESKEIALLQGLKIVQADNLMGDSIILETKKLYGNEAKSKIFDLWLDNYNVNGFKKAIASYGDITNFDNSSMIKLIQEWSSNRSSKELFNAISAFKNRSINYLISNIQENYAQEILAKLGKPALAQLQRKMNSPDEETWTAAASTIVKMSKYHPETTDYLYKAVENSNLLIVARNYRFYIKAGIKGSENIMIKALDDHFSEDMCIDYINCEYDHLQELAKGVANKHGYSVYTFPGRHYGPRWGEGN
jgi:hypothetical protein